MRQVECQSPVAIAYLQTDDPLPVVRWSGCMLAKPATAIDNRSTGQPATGHPSASRPQQPATGIQRALSAAALGRRFDGTDLLDWFGERRDRGAAADPA